MSGGLGLVLVLATSPRPAAAQDGMPSAAALPPPPTSSSVVPGGPSLSSAAGEPVPRAPAPGAAAPIGGSDRVVPPLEVVLKKAGERAPQVRLGTAALGVSQSAYTNARRPPLGNPYFEVVGQHGSNNTTQGISVIGTLWLPLEIVGQRGKRVAEADAYVDLHQRTLETARAAALGEAVNAYGSAVVAAERVRVLEEIVRNSRTTADLYEARLQAGDAILRDATIARVELGKNEVLLQDAHGRMVLAFADLARLTGERYDSVDTAAVAPPDLAVDDYLARVREEAPPAVRAAEAEAKYFASQNERLQRESYGNLQLMLMGGRGDIGETRLGAGIAYEVPAFRTNQGEKARAQAEKLRAETERIVRQSYIDTRISGILQQYNQLKKAHEVMSQVALPAANDAVAASQATLQAGKDDWFIVLMTRRDQAMLRLQNLDLLERQWILLGELVHLTGELP